MIIKQRYASTLIITIYCYLKDKKKKGSQTQKNTAKQKQKSSSANKEKEVSQCLTILHMLFICHLQLKDFVLEVGSSPDDSDTVDDKVKFIALMMYNYLPTCRLEHKRM